MQNSFWQNKKVVVTGGTGFIGSHVVEILIASGAKVTVPSRNSNHFDRFLSTQKKNFSGIVCDLSAPKQAESLMQGQDIVLHLAAAVGGIEYNIKHPASIFIENLRVFMNCLEASRNAQVERFLVTSSACVYPRICSIPTPEEEGFKDRPEPTNEGYGWAKRMEEFLGQAAHHEWGMKIAIARPYNCYGPRDNFDPKSSHVIPALIRRIFADRERPLQVWGSGQQSRGFLYVEDFARGLIETTEKYAQADPINIGASEETTIAELVENLNEIHQELFGERFAVQFDTSKPEGQPRRRCDTTKAEKVLGYKAQWQLRDGLKETVKWYLANAKPKSGA